MKHYLTALCKAYPENSFNELLNRKLIDNNSTALILNQKYNTSEALSIQQMENKKRATETRLETVLENNKKKVVKKKPTQSTNRTKRIKSSKPKYTKED